MLTIQLIGAPSFIMEIVSASLWVIEPSRGPGVPRLHNRLRTGIGRSALSRLENDEIANPTIVTLTRYADALGKKLSIALAEKEGSESMT